MDKDLDIVIYGATGFTGKLCVKAGANIGHHSVVAAGTIVEAKKIPPYSLVYGNPMKIKKNYYKKK